MLVGERDAAHSHERHKRVLLKRVHLRPSVGPFSLAPAKNAAQVAAKIKHQIGGGSSKAVASAKTPKSSSFCLGEGRTAEFSFCGVLIFDFLVMRLHVSLVPRPFDFVTTHARWVASANKDVSGARTAIPDRFVLAGSAILLVLVASAEPACADHANLRNGQGKQKTVTNVRRGIAH